MRLDSKRYSALPCEAHARNKSELLWPRQAKTDVASLYENVCMCVCVCVCVSKCANEEEIIQAPLHANLT